MFAFSILGLLVAILAVVNFPSWGSWQTGWDNLHPEFNFFLNVKRSFFAMWQEFQGVGLVGGHGYAATLPHTIILLILSWFLPDFALRTIFTFLMLCIGVTGVYTVTKTILHRHTTPLITMAASLVAGVFTMLSIGTIQNFYIQLEAFIVHYASLPWLLLSVYWYWNKPSKKRLFFFIVINLIAAPSGFIPPLFVVQCGAIGVLLTMLLLNHLHQWKSGIRKGITIVATIAMLNAYWLIPVAFYTKGYTQNYLNAYNNINSTENFIIQNEKYGNVLSVALGKSFLFDANDATDTGTVVPLLSPWINHFSHPGVQAIAYVVFIIACIGCITSQIRPKHNLQRVIALLFLLFLTFMATNTPPFSWVSETLQTISPIFRQAFRVTFTKFSIAYGMTLAIMFGIGLAWILNLFKRKDIVATVAIVSCIGILYYSFPSFQGHYTYIRTRQTIPKDYFDLFSYLKTQPNGRIMNLPQGWNWGWTVTNWGYTGSGFLWYGIEQPIMDRAFDVWSRNNEQYYWELVYALYSNNPDLVRSLLYKYDIQWLLYDPTVVPYLQPKYVFQEEKIRTLLTKIPEVLEVQKFGTLTIFTFQNQRSQEFVQKTGNLPNILPVQQWITNDMAFTDTGDYKSDVNVQADIWYPYRSLFSYREPILEGNGINKQTTGYLLRSNYVPANFVVQTPDYQKNELYAPLQLVIDKREREYVFVVQYVSRSPFTGNIVTEVSRWSETITTLTDAILYFNGEEITSLSLTALPNTITTLGLVGRNNNVSILTPTGETITNHGFTFSYSVNQNYNSYFVPFVQHPYSYYSNNDQSFFFHNLHTCTELTPDVQPTTELPDGKALVFESDTTDVCFDVILQRIPHTQGYIIEIENQYEQGRALSFSVINLTTRKSDLEIQLPQKKEKSTSYVIIPPMQSDGLGYALKFINKKGEKTVTKNYLYGVKVTPFPYMHLSSLQYKNLENVMSDGDVKNEIEVYHPNPTYYRVSTYTEPQENLILYQSFDPGWKAYKVNSKLGETLPFLFGKELNNHVLVNNWANGWELKDISFNNGEETTIVFFFLPQLLQWFGFVLLPLSFLPLLLWKNKSYSSESKF